MVDGKAKLMREECCDGFGDCLPECPAGAIAFEEREAPAYDAAAVKQAQQVSVAPAQETGARTNGMPHPPAGGCPGSRMRELPVSRTAEHGCPGSGMHRMDSGKGMQDKADGRISGEPVSRLAQWPCQIKLLPVRAPFFDGARLLIAADCTAYAYASLHEQFMKGRVTLIGCPKLDGVDYAEKFAEILRNNEIREVTIVRMEVPCCGGLQRAAEQAIRDSGKFLPWQVVTISIDGKRVED